MDKNLYLLIINIIKQIVSIQKYNNLILSIKLMSSLFSIKSLRFLKNVLIYKLIEKLCLHLM